MNADKIRSTAEAWAKAHNEADESELDRIGREHAQALGLPVMAALFDALVEVNRAKGMISPAEVQSLLRPVLSIAIGEGQSRLRIATGDEWISLPGVPTIPHNLLEQFSQE